MLTRLSIVVWIFLLLIGCGRSSGLSAPEWWKQVRSMDYLGEEFEETVRAAKSQPTHKKDIIRIASTLNSTDAAERFSVALLILASQDNDEVYLEVARSLDQRFPNSPGSYLMATAGVMQGREAARLLFEYLFQRSDAEWPLAYHAITGLRDNPNWDPSEAPPFEVLIASERPLLAKLAIANLLLSVGAYEYSKVCGWQGGVSVEEVDPMHQRFVLNELEFLREKCD